MKKRLRNCVIITLAIVICCGTTALLESKFARDNTVETYSVSQFDSITEYVDSIKGKKVSPFSRKVKLILLCLLSRIPCVLDIFCYVQ